MFGIDNLCWMSVSATSEASRLAEFLILRTGMTAFGKAYYRNNGDLVPNVRVYDLSLTACVFEYILFPMTEVFYEYKQVRTHVQMFCTACSEA